jgi:hypothetical protein
MTDPDEVLHPRWAVVLRGDDHDLEALGEHFTGHIRVDRGPDGWELSAYRFEETEDRMAVYEAAVELVDRLRGLMVAKLASDPWLEMGPVMELLPDGSRRPHVFARAEMATARARIHAAGVVTYPDGTVPEPPPVPSWEPIIELAVRDDAVRLALALLAAPPTWSRLYAVLDLVVQDERTDRRAGVERRGDVMSEVERFTWTANNVWAIGVDARHGRLDWKPPSSPMSLEEASDLIGRTVEAWIDELIQGESLSSDDHDP